MKLFNPEDDTITIPAQGTWPERRHLFDEKSKWAVDTALMTGRPLLLRGEPGIGRSQLARAAAHVLGVPFLSYVVDERTERDDLLFRYDAVSRLALAQMAQEGKEEALDRMKFIYPGVLWRAFDWAGAETQDGKCHEKNKAMDSAAVPNGWSAKNTNFPCGPVVLVDELDKADPSVPNGLLESLGNDGFDSPMLDKRVKLPEGAKPPLVMITTNEERELPAAFLRRCLVLQFHFPKESSEATEFLKKRAAVFHEDSEISEVVVELVIQTLLKDREAAEKHGMAMPGAAEFLDILNALKHFKGDAAQKDAFAEIKNFAFRKNLEK